MFIGQVEGASALEIPVAGIGKYRKIKTGFLSAKGAAWQTGNPWRRTGRDPDQLAAEVRIASIRSGTLIGFDTTRANSSRLGIVAELRLEP